MGLPKTRAHTRMRPYKTDVILGVVDETWSQPGGPAPRVAPYKCWRQ